MNGPLKFLTARKILPLLAKFIRVLACSCSPNFCIARKLAKQIFISARAHKKIAVLSMLANARKDHSSPLIVVVNIIIQYIYLLSFLSPFSFLLLLFCVVLVLFYFILFFFGGGG